MMLLRLAMFCAVLLSVIALSMSEFTVFNQQRLRPWTMHYSVDDEDCSESGLLAAFPAIYTTQNIPQHIGPGRNLTITQIEREALERGGTKNYYFPGAVMKFFPPDTGFDQLTGYEIILIRNEITVCIVLDFANRSWQQENEIDFELFPLHGLTHYQVILSTLPKYRPQQTLPVQHLATSQYARYQPPNAPLEPSANWVAAVSYYILNEIAHNVTRYSVEVVFSRPPREYNFHQFEVALVPTNHDTVIRKVATDIFFHVFEDVPLGDYKILLWPIDVYFSQPGRCLCRNIGGACSNCVTTEVQTIRVPRVV